MPTYYPHSSLGMSFHSRIISQSPYIAMLEGIFASSVWFKSFHPNPIMFWIFNPLIQFTLIIINSFTVSSLPFYVFLPPHLLRRADWILNFVDLMALFPCIHTPTSASLSHVACYLNAIVFWMDYLFQYQYYMFYLHSSNGLKSKRLPIWLHIKNDMFLLPHG